MRRDGWWDHLADHHRRPLWSRILLTLAPMGARCGTDAHDERPADLPHCFFHGTRHADCWRNRTVGKAF